MMAAMRLPLLATVSACLLVAFAACSGDDDAAPTSGPTSVTPDAYILYRDSSASIIARNLATDDLFEYPADLETGAVVATACVPDGSRLALLKQSFETVDRQLLVVGRDAPAEPFTLPPAVLGIEWSPDGSRVAYTEFDGVANEYSISVLDVATGNSTALTSGEGVTGVPSWLPDGATIAYNVQDVLATVSSIYLLDATAGGTPERVDAREDLLYFDPVWSPEGSTLLVAGQSETDTQLYEVNPETGDTEQFTSSDVFKRLPQYAPDGETIAYTGSVIPATVARYAAILHQFGIFLLDADGGNERALTADPRLNPGAGIDPDLDAFLMGWCLPGPWLDDSWIEVVETPAP
jgi:Tol biopolymer transport system component